jgi:hypothetical protein
VYRHLPRPLAAEVIQITKHPIEYLASLSGLLNGHVICLMLEPRAAPEFFLGTGRLRDSHQAKMSLGTLLNNADCGPSNPLQQLSKRLDTDRGIQQVTDSSGLSQEHYHQ